MAQSFSTSSGLLVKPGVYSTITVQTSNSGIAVNGVLVLIGEAQTGPDFTLESDLTLNGFAPSQFSAVQAKYGAGRIVDAFQAASQASADPNIIGSPFLIYILKTNPSGKASSNLLTPSASPYATLQDASYGALGNQLNYTITAPITEVVPTTGAFTWIPPVGTVNATVVVNGGPIIPLSIGANTTPTAFAALTVAGATLSGGAVKATIQASVGTLAVGTPSGNTVIVTYSGVFTVTPSVGDTVIIPATSVIASAAGASASGANVGGYVVVAATANTITMTKLSDNNKSGAVAGIITAPVAVTASAVSATVANEIVDYGSVTVAVATAVVIEGVGKSLEISDLASGSDLLARYAFQLSVTPVTWISLTGAPKLLTSADELEVALNVFRASTSTNTTLAVGGEVLLQVSVNGAGVTAATLTVSPTGITTTITGGSLSNLVVPFSQFQTMAAVAQFINSQAGYSAKTGTVVLGNLPSTALDKGTFNILSQFGAQNGRIKDDAYRFAQAVATSGVVILAAPPVLGLPALVPLITFLAGGTLGGTTNANVFNALLAAQLLTVNFVIPLFSQNATLDIAQGLTDPSSTYDITSINADVKSHVLFCNTLVQRKDRQGFLSILDTFDNAQNAAANTATSLCSMCFQSVSTLNAQGTVVLQQPWMASVIAAAMQAAGAYRSITFKFANISSAIQVAGDYNYQQLGDVTAALLAGLLPLERAATGGYRWVSDQTTYGIDNNFSYNSIQSVYASAVVALTLDQDLENAFIGQSLADVSAGIILSFIDGIMANLFRLKWIAASDDAPLGFKNANVSVAGPAFIAGLEAKVAGALYFGLVNVLIGEITQTATNSSTVGA